MLRHAREEIRRPLRLRRFARVRRPPARDSRPATRKRFGPSFWTRLAPGHRALIGASSSVSAESVGPDQQQVALSFAALFRGSTIGKLKITLVPRAADAIPESADESSEPLAGPNRAGRGRAQTVFDPDLAAGHVGDALPVLKARVSIAWEPKDDPPRVRRSVRATPSSRAKFRQSGGFISFALPVTGPW